MIRNLKSNSRGTALPLERATSSVSTADVELMSSSISNHNIEQLFPFSQVRHIYTPTNPPAAPRSAGPLTNVRKVLTLLAFITLETVLKSDCRWQNKHLHCCHLLHFIRNITDLNRLIFTSYVQYRCNGL
jgi:hypothetical protein